MYFWDYSFIVFIELVAVLPILKKGWNYISWLTNSQTKLFRYPHIYSLDFCSFHSTLLCNDNYMLSSVPGSNIQTKRRSPKSKSGLMTGFSLKWIFQPPPASQPLSHPGKVSQKQDTIIYPKPKLLVYIMRLWNMLWNKPRPKIDPLWVKPGRKPSIQEFFNHAK